MSSDRNLQYISSKIAAIQVARFHCTSSSILKIPPAVIRTFKVDDDGHVLFFLPRPSQLISQFDKDFPVELNYVRKGISGYLNVSGKARIINDPEELYEYELTEAETTRALSRDVLIVVKILKADYHRCHITTKDSLATRMKAFIYALLAGVEPSTRSYEFSKTPVPNYGF